MGDDRDERGQRFDRGIEETVSKIFWQKNIKEWRFWWADRLQKKKRIENRDKEEISRRKEKSDLNRDKEIARKGNNLGN